MTMKRRDFITLLGGGAAAWPLVARAQQPALPVIGYLATGGPNYAAMQVAAFHKGLNEMGFVEHQNVGLDYRWAEGRYDRLPVLAADLVGRKVVLIVTNGTLGALAAKSATATIPIVFLNGGDPVTLGLVASFSRPGSNLTGITLYTNELWTKRIALMRELVPSAELLGMLVNPANPLTESAVRDAREAARVLGRRILVLDGSTASKLDTAFTDLVGQGAGALVVQDEPTIGFQLDQLVALAARHAIPAGYPLREHATAGGLMSYGPSIVDGFYQMGVYAGKILKGAKPDDLPVVVPTKFDFVLNLKTAKALGITVPPTLLAIADDVIE
jgi:putative ABC transport system substrate-binding protein